MKTQPIRAFRKSSERAGSHQSTPPFGHGSLTHLANLHFNRHRFIALQLEGGCGVVVPQLS